MLNVKDILSIEFYKKSPFYGSFQGIRYKIEKYDDESDTKLMLTTWPEPLGYDATDKSLMEYYKTSFDDEGLEDIVNHINAMEV